MYLGDENMLYPLDQTIFDSLAWVYHQMWRVDLRYAIVVGLVFTLLGLFCLILGLF